MKEFSLKAHRPLLISGPCSAETEEQTIETCRQLAATGKVDVLRAGIWKPRTAPGSFEGVGEIGLTWLEEAKRITGLPVAVEVATPSHVELALAHGVDVLWIGARSTVNPFYVQDIADALHGVKDVSVLIKNPVNPDIALWEGAVARMATGIDISKIGLIHRGFSYAGHKKYRNSPMWHLAIEMRERFPDMAVICDPSHIGGNSAYLREIAQAAADMHYDGLMIESHISPASALSDAQQQITPAEYGRLIGSINWRSAMADNPGFNERLAEYRAEIDQIDDELLALLGRRMQVIDKIGEVKKANNVAILQSSRWNAIVQQVLAKAAGYGLREEFIKSILEVIHVESIERQDDIMNKQE